MISLDQYIEGDQINLMAEYGTEDIQDKGFIEWCTELWNDYINTLETDREAYILFNA